MSHNTSLNQLQSWFASKNFYSQQVLEDENKLFNEGRKKALELFHAASQRIPAYKDFLKKSKISPEKIKTSADYKKLPVMTKENYVQVYPFEMRTWDGNLERIQTISTSSGTTGEPHYWPRTLENEIEGAFPHELILIKVFHVDSIPTLFINGFELGNWIAGTYTSACINLLIWKGYPITLMNTGYSLEDVVKTLLNIGSLYKQIIITGHTPFLKEIIEQLAKKGDHLLVKLRLLGAGQAITEQWREYMLKKLDQNNNYSSILNLYGSADASLMGFETPLSISIHKSLSQDPNLCKKIFGGNRLPSLYNYDPRLIFFEEQTNELLITKNSGVPLIRYNIHDEGGILYHSKLINQIILNKDFNLEEFNWKLPFVFLFGRDKFMVKIFGANIYSEHVAQALNHESLQSHITGQYNLQIVYDGSHNTRMVCNIELNENIKPSDELIKLIKKIFIAEVRKINSEFNDALTRMGEKVEPIILVHPYGDTTHFPKGKIKKNA